MSSITPYAGFYTTDSSGNNWWARMAFIPVASEMGLVCMQDVGFEVDDKQYLRPKKDLILGFVIGSDAQNAIDQLTTPTFDRNLGDSEILWRLEAQLVSGDLLKNIKDTAKERNKDRLVSAGELYDFDRAVCTILEKVGFEATELAEGTLMTMKV